MKMTLGKTLGNLVKAVVEEADRNPDFAKRLKSALGTNPDAESSFDKRGSRRRNPAVLDPVSLVRQGEDVLRKQLDSLSVEELKDIVAQYGMDPGKMAMKWKTPDRLIDRIVEYSVSRSKKGEAFLR